jgi:hypothetical protein
MNQFNQLPYIRRARDFHVYDIHGHKYLDLYRADGAALLGHSVPGLAKAAKNRLDQHVYGGYPHVLQAQLAKALAVCFPGRQVTTFTNDRQLRGVAQNLGLNLSEWQPFLPATGESFIARLPGLGPEIPAILVSSATTRPLIDAGPQYLSPPGLSALLRLLPLLRQLGAFTAVGGPPDPQSGLDLHRSVIGDWGESAWSQVVLGQWSRRGPYLEHHFDQNQYISVFQNALKQKVILNPLAQGLNILPGILTNGEQKTLEAVLSFTPGGQDASAIP